MDNKPTRQQRFKNWANRNSEILFGIWMVSVFGATLHTIEKMADKKLPEHGDIWTTDRGDRAMLITSRDGTLTRLDYTTETNQEV